MRRPFRRPGRFVPHKFASPPPAAGSALAPPVFRALGVGGGLAIEADARSFQALGETAVGETFRADSSVEPLNPEHAEVAFAGFAIPVGPIFGLHHRVFRVTKEFGPASAITSRGIDDAFAALPAGGRVSGSWHVVVPRTLSGLLFQRVVRFGLICPTSLADLVLQSRDQVGRSSRRLRARAGRKSNWLTLNNKLFCRSDWLVVAIDFRRNFRLGL